MGEKRKPYSLVSAVNRPSSTGIDPDNWLPSSRLPSTPAGGSQHGHSRHHTAPHDTVHKSPPHTHTAATTSSHTEHATSTIHHNQTPAVRPSATHILNHTRGRFKTQGQAMKISCGTRRFTHTKPWNSERCITMNEDESAALGSTELSRRDFHPKGFCTRDIQKLKQSKNKSTLSISSVTLRYKHRLNDEHLGLALQQCPRIRMPQRTYHTKTTGLLQVTCQCRWSSVGCEAWSCSRWLRRCTRSAHRDTALGCGWTCRCAQRKPAGAATTQPE